MYDGDGRRNANISNNFTVRSRAAHYYDALWVVGVWAHELSSYGGELRICVAFRWDVHGSIDERSTL